MTTTGRQKKGSETEDCVLREQRVHAAQEFGAEREAINSFLLVKAESDEGNYM